MEKPKYQCKNVVASSHSSQNQSRYELLKWINESLHMNVRNVEVLCTGAVYCQLMELLFPGCINLKKVKLQATMQFEYTSNWRQLQLSFRAVGCDKDVPIEKLIMGRFQENFEFLQWFKKFFDVNIGSACAEYVPKTLPKKNPRPAEASSVVKGASSQLERDLRSQMGELTEKRDVLERERDFYYSKLRNIEAMLTDPDLEANPIDKGTLISKILSELYATAEEEEETEPVTDKTF